MYRNDLALLRCPATGAALHLAREDRLAPDGEILDGALGGGARLYPVVDGIPRFVADVAYNASWDFKWRELDGGRALNYRIIDKSDPAYAIHDIFDRNDHGGAAYRHAHGRVVLDFGCGIGQYSVKMALEHAPAKLVALDLTGGVDIFRRVLDERYPELKRKILIVQASILEPPFAPETFDYVFSLGVLMHTGDTRKALDTTCRMVKPGGELNAWIYSSGTIAIDAIEAGRDTVMTIANARPTLRIWRQAMFWIRLFRAIDHKHAVRILRLMSSDRVYGLSGRRPFRWIRRIFPMVEYPDAGYRLINNYDGYVNNWCDTWSEGELFPVLQRNSVALLGLSTWRLGFWGRKIPGFYEADEAAAESSARPAVEA